MIVWGNLVFRSWNSGTPAPQQVDPNDPTDLDDIPTTDPRRFTVPGAFCDNWPMFREPAAAPLPERGQEGVHVIDISNPLDPVVVAFVDAPCGSHTATGVPDLANNRFLIYNSPSANTVFGGTDPAVEPIECRGVDIIEVPLANPAAASYLRQVPSGDPAEPPAERHACHDTGVILGDALKMACAGGDAISIFTLDPGRRRFARRPDVHAPRRVPGCQHRPLGRVQRGRRDRHLRPRAGRRQRRPAARRRAVSPTARSTSSTSRPALWPDAAAPASADRHRELHLAQLQRRPD